MSKVKVMGKKSGSFTSEKTGEVIEFARLYVLGDFPASDYADAPKTEGKQCEEVKLSVSLFNSVKVGEDIIILYNSKGRVEDIMK